MLYLPAMMHQRHRPASARRFAAAWCITLAAVLSLLWPTRARAHEIPQRVAVRAFVQQQDTTLHLLLRVPLEAMRDVDWPLRDDGSLDLVRARPLLAEAARTWLANAIRITADGQPVGDARIAGTRLALPNDRSFDTFAAASAAFASAPLDSVIIQWNQVLFDVALDYTVPSRDTRLVLHPDLATLGIRTNSVLHVVQADGSVRTLAYEGNPESVPLRPAWWQVATQFTRTGFQHILGGIDHILFILCLVIGVRGVRAMVATITAFTVAHSITLIAAALGVVPDRLWFPPLVEVLIAASIVWVALENIVLSEERLVHRWAVAFLFGLVHGFGFSFALAEQQQFAGGSLVSALLSFNIGVELGQMAVLAAAVPVLLALTRYAGAGRERVLQVVLSVLVAHTAWHWMTERADALAAHRGSIGWPAADLAMALLAIRGLLLAAIAVAAALALRQILRTARQS